MLEGNVPQHLYEIYRHFDEGRWFLPKHQRKLVWGETKMKKWFENLKSIHELGGGEVEGCIIIYKLPGENKIYLNDGAQRVYWTIQKFIEYCKINEMDWKQILSSVKITVQSVKYNNISEAISGFIQINFGTTATPYELTRTMMCELLEDFDTVWEPRLRKVQDIIKTALLTLNVDMEDRNKVEQRDLAHKRMRDELHIFWKFLSGDTTQWSPRVALSNLNPDKWDEETKLEKNLIGTLNSIGLANIDQKIKSFSVFVSEMIALYQQIWNEIQPTAKRPANVHVRWWLCAVIYLKNSNLDNNLREFTEKLIRHSEGRTSLFYTNDDGKQCNCNTAMSKLQQIGMISKIIGIELDYKNARKKLTDNLLKKGFVHSHVKAFSQHGEGQTLAENAFENRKRSAATMTQDEQERLEKFNQSKPIGSD